MCVLLNLAGFILGCQGAQFVSSVPRCDLVSHPKTSLYTEAVPGLCGFPGVPAGGWQHPAPGRVLKCNLKSVKESCLLIILLKLSIIFFQSWGQPAELQNHGNVQLVNGWVRCPQSVFVCSHLKRKNGYYQNTGQLSFILSLGRPAVIRHSEYFLYLGDKCEVYTIHSVALSGVWDSSYNRKLVSRGLGILELYMRL